MSKGKKGIDGQTAFDWDRAIDDHVARKNEIIEACYRPPIQESSLSMTDACMEVVMGIKRALRQSGLSREQLVDSINDYFGWNDGESKKLSIHMFNHYLSKPSEYHIPAYLLIPIVIILSSLEPVQVIVDTVGGRVISGAEVRLMNLGKLEATIAELQRLKRELKGAGK